MKNEEKKMKKKVIASILAASMAAMALTGCGGGKTTSEAQGATTDETTASTEAGSTADGAEAPDLNQDTKGTTITFWHSMGGVNGEAMDYLVNKFNEENTDGITVEAVYQGEYDDTINKLKSAQIGNMGADLVQIYDIGTRFMIDSGWVIPMQELINADGYDISRIEPNIAAYYTVNNELYSMPFNSSTPILYYNKDMFEKAGITEVPTSLEGILAIGDDLKTKGGAGEPLALSIYGWYFEQWLCKQGLPYADNGNGRDAAATAVEFDSNGGALNILNEWKALNDADVAPNVGRAGSDTATTDFTSGKAAITLGSTASLKQILQDVNGSFEVGTAYFPTIKDGDEGGVSIGGASLWALNNNDDAKAAATWKFIKFLISPESQAYWNAETGYFPVTTAADEEQLGNAIRQSGIKREEFFITTKLWVQDYEYDDALRAFDLSMKKLGLDYLDLYLMHKPYGNYYAAWRAMERLYKEGRIRAIGVTSFSNERLQDLFLHNEIKPVVNQLETHPFFQQQAANAFLQQEGIQHEAWAPFAEGQNDIFNHPTLKAIAEQHDKGVGAIILRWLNQRNIVVIPKSVHKERMIENFNILDFTLSKEEMDAIALLETGKSPIYDDMDLLTVKGIGLHKIHE